MKDSRSGEEIEHEMETEERVDADIRLARPRKFTFKSSELVNNTFHQTSHSFLNPDLSYVALDCIKEDESVIDGSATQWHGDAMTLLCPKQAWDLRCDL